MSTDGLVRLSAPVGPLTAREFVAEVFAEPALVAVMIASVDGRAAIGGRSTPLGHPADRALLREMRTGADALLVGPRTLAAERYANLLDTGQRELRVAHGRAAHPLIATVSRSGDVPRDVPVFSEDGVEVLVYASIDEALADLADRGAHRVSCEGGPTLVAALVAAGRLDGLVLTIAPLLGAGAEPTLLTGDALEPPVPLALRDVLRAAEGDHVFLRYARPPS